MDGSPAQQKYRALPSICLQESKVRESNPETKGKSNPATTSLDYLGLFYQLKDLFTAQSAEENIKNFILPYHWCRKSAVATGPSSECRE